MVGSALSICSSAKATNLECLRQSPQDTPWPGVPIVKIFSGGMVGFHTIRRRRCVSFLLLSSRLSAYVVRYEASTHEVSRVKL